MWAFAAATALLGDDRDALGNAGRLPGPLRDYYTQGACEDLADAMHALTGWPVVLVADRGGIAGWVHAGVQAPTGVIFDADGRHDPLDWLDTWALWVDAYGEGLEGFDPALVDVVARSGFERSS